MPSPELDEGAHQVQLPGGIESRLPLIIILGPTAAGKTEISLQLAERLDGEIVSADSRLFYRGMDVGTAKPSPAERACIPHHLVDIADPDEPMNLATYQQAARQAIAGIHARGRLPFLVGGTGQYIRAVIEGWNVPGVAADPALRSALERWAETIGASGLHDRLATLDPQAAQRIDPRNLRRTVRALEVILTSGRKFSQQRRRSSSPYRSLTLGLTRPRADLYQRIDARIHAMLEGGFIDECQALLAQGYSPQLPTFSAIGYPEIFAYLRGETSLEEAEAQMQRATRVLVRRQANWFKVSDPNIHWFVVGPGVVEKLDQTIRAWLSV